MNSLCLDLHDFVRQHLADALRTLGANAKIVWRDGDLATVRVTLPPQDSSSDFATNAALVLAKQNRTAPREIARQLADYFTTHHSAVFREVEVAGAGFVNFTLREQVWSEWLKLVLTQPQGLSQVDVGAGERINIEYVSANPTGPLHVAHARTSVVGDALANILTAVNYRVTREYYINDAGAQIDKLTRSSYLRYREALGEDIGEIADGMYPGTYLQAVGRQLAREHGDALRTSDNPISDANQTNPPWFTVVRQAAVAAIMAGIKSDLAALGIHHDVFFSERTLIEPDDIVARMIADLKGRDLAYTGTLQPPRGSSEEADAQPAWEERELTLFRSTQFGDDVDRPLLKPEGGYTYFGIDAAYHYSKLQRGADRLIDVLGADHSGYVTRISSAVDALSGKNHCLRAVVCQMVRLSRGGEALVMSKRSGQFVTLRELIDEVGSDAIRFMMLFRRNDAQLDFDLSMAVEQTRDNPVFYVQYAHARIASVLRRASEIWTNETFRAESINADTSGLLHNQTIASTLRVLAQLPSVVRAAATHFEPHRIAFYAYDLANALHVLWAAGRSDRSLRFVDETDLQGTKARLAILIAVQSALAQSLALLGVSAPEELTGGDITEPTLNSTPNSE